MTFDEFDEVMKPFLATFGAQNYPEPKLDMIFEESEDLTRTEFRWVVRHFIADIPVKYPPQPNQFREAAAHVRKNRADRQATAVGNQEFKYGDGLTTLLKEMNASSALEAMSKMSEAQIAEKKKSWGIN